MYVGTNGWMDVCWEGRVDGDGCMEVRVDRWMHERMDGWVQGRTNREVDACTDAHVQMNGWPTIVWPAHQHVNASDKMMRAWVFSLCDRDGPVDGG